MGNCGIILLRRVRCTCDKLNYRSYKRLNEYHNIIKIGDSDNVSKTTMRFHLIVLSMAALIMMRPVVHLPTFQPPVDNASLGALSPAKDFYHR